MRIVPCKQCKAPLVFARFVTTGNLGAFNAAPLASNEGADARHCWIVSGAQAMSAWTFADKQSPLLELSEEEARHEVRAHYPWHTLHDCPNRTEPPA